MKVGLLGGAFNPPHIGHVLIARQVLDFTDIEKVWFLPNYGQLPAKPDMAPVEHRLAMARLLEYPDTEVSTIEIDHQLTGHTVEILSYLAAYKEHQFTFIMGSDQLSSFHTWGRWEELLNSLPFLIVPRGGYPFSPLRLNMTPLEHPLLVSSNISSTLIRKRIQEGLSIDYFVPPQVKKYIEERGLYR